MAPVERDERRHHLRQRLEQLEAELVGVHSELAKIGSGEALPGLYLLVEASAVAAAIPTSEVVEIVRLVETQPLPQAPAHVLGTFLYRGEAVLAVDLAAFVSGERRDPALDAHMVVLATARPMALVVDRVKALVEAPVLAQAPADAPAWLTSRLVAALCRADDALVPILRLEQLLEGVPK